VSFEAPALFPPARELAPKLGDRGLFGGLAPLVYMNHAGISPPSILVKKAMQTQLADYMKRGAAAYPSWAEQRLRLKRSLAKLIGAASADQLALVQNTTSGVVAVAQCLDWRPGDGVVVFEGEFPSNVTPWQVAARDRDLTLHWLDGRRYLTHETEELSRLEATLAGGGVRVVAVSAVQFQTGYAMPLAAMSSLARRYGARLFVDAVQACGMVPLDVVSLGVDFLACGAHKWLMGVEGAGFLYATPDAAADLVPRLAGWLSHEDAIDFLFEGEGKLLYDKPIRRGVSFLEAGNVSASAFAALEASLGPLEELGVAVIFDHVQRIHDAIEQRAVEMGFQSLRAPHGGGRSGSLCLRPPRGVDVLAVYRHLVAQGVACAVPDGVLRFSPHWPNAIDEADQVVLTLEHALVPAVSS
jgi:cysteine desulfurase / selenocysteine lyase